MANTKNWITPMGEYFELYENMMEQPHLLIAGATGSGKSVVINGIITTALFKAPTEVQFILIDPKRVELVDYRYLPHTAFYASEPDDMVRALQMAMNIIEMRYKQMQSARQKKYTGTELYVIIDELADLMTTNKKQVMPLIQRIAQVGRAAGVHLICATQCPLAKVIPTEIKVNFDARVGLRTRSAQDSRNILGFNGCEELPRYGQAFYMNPDIGIERKTILMYDQSVTWGLISHWMQQSPPKKKGFFARLFGM
nr:FtsK/SpoIIIE domain-containing protein [uncultured Mediterraneibacter sp.]